MPESDGAEIRRRPNELSCPEAIGEISHIPSGDRDSATTLGGVLDPMRGVIAVRLSLIALVSASRPDAVTKFGCGEIGRSGSSTSAAASALSSRVKATLICFDFPSQASSNGSRACPQNKNRLLQRLSSKGPKLAPSKAEAIAVRNPNRRRLRARRTLDFPPAAVLPAAPSRRTP